MTRLLDAASVVFARRGFFAASVEEVAEEAGFSKGAVYSNFKSKDELLLAMMQRHMAERIARIEEVAEKALRRGQSRAIEVAQAFMEILDADEDWMLLMLEFWACAGRNPEMRNRLAVHRRKMHLAVAEMVEAGTKSEGIRLDLPPEVVASAVFAIGDGIALERFSDPDGVPRDLMGIVLGRFFEALHLKDPDPTPPSE
jgi:AcrR family transcriptional regulator